MKIAHVFRYKIFVYVGIVGFFVGCNNRPGVKLASQATHLPTNWYSAAAPLPVSPSVQPITERPSLAADASIKTQFRAYTEALAEVAPIPGEVAPSRHPADWVPWHVDGMIAQFTIDTSGLFGVLIGDGTASVKTQWQQQSEPPPSVVRAHPKASNKRAAKKHFAFRTTMAMRDVSAMLEPVVQSAIAAHAVTNEAEFRRNAVAQGQQFLALAKVLDGVPSRPGWRVDGLQAQLTFTAEGQVSAAVGVGGQLNIYFDWQKSEGPPSSGAVRAGELFQNVIAFTQGLSALIPEALLNSREMRKAGLTLDEFQVGVALIGGVQIGIAQAQGAISGKIIFKRDVPKERALASDLSGFRELNQPSEFKTVPYAASIPTILEDALSWSARDESSGLAQVPVDVFRSGLVRAIDMAAYFTQKAEEVKIRNWQVVQVETEFDASLGGNFQVVTIEGQGQFVLDFDRVSN